MPYFPGAGFSWSAFGLACAIVFGMMALFLSLIVATSDPRKWEERQRIYDAALETWLAECKEPRGQCALQWDRSPSLRDLYIKRIK